MSNGTSINNNQTGVWQVGNLPTPQKVAKTTQLDPQVLTTLAPIKDQMAAPAKQGQATVASFVDSPNVQEFKSLLANKKYDDLVSLVKKMSHRDLDSLNLSTTEIRDLAQQFGATDLLSSFSYSETEQFVIRKMIMLSDKIPPDQKISLLQELGGGNAAVLDYLNQASLKELSGLSPAKRQALLGSLLNTNDTLGNVGGALKELVVRRGMGDHEKEEDILTSKLMRSAASETEVRQLFDSINSFERDDIAFQYVTAMSATQLSKLSDDFKIHLLKTLVDSSVSLPFMDMDFNAMGNLDETLGMTFKEHTKAAVLLYKAMSAKSQQRKDVQQAVQKSDDLAAELAKIEQAIAQATQSKTLDLPQIASFKTQLQQFKSTDPQVQQKITALLKTLDSLEQELGSASKLHGIVNQELNRAKSTAKELQQTVTQTTQKLTVLGETVKKTQAQMPALEKQLLTQYKAALDLRKNLSGLGDEYQKLLTEYQQVLESQGNTSSKVTQLEQLSRKLAAVENSASQLDTKNAALGEQLNTLEKEVSATRQAFEQNVQLLNKQETQYQAQLNSLTTQLGRLQGSVKQLEKIKTQAQQQLEQIKPTLPAGTDTSAVEQEISAVDKQIQSYQQAIQASMTQLSQELGPQLKQLQAAKAQIADAEASVTKQLDGLDNSFMQARALQEEVTETVDQTQSLLDQLRSDVQSLSQQAKTATAADIKSMLQRLEGLKTQLTSSTAEASEVQTLKQEMAQLQGLLTELQTQMKSTQGTTSELMGKLKEAQDIKKSLQTELQKSKKSVDNAQTSIAKSQQVIASINAQLPELKQQLSSKQKEAAELEKQLASTYDTIAKSKQAYAKSQASGSGSLWGSVNNAVQEAALIASIKAQETAQTTLKKQLDALKADMRGVEQDITSQQKNLQTHKTQLGKDQTRLQKLKGESDKLLTKLEQTQQQNATLLAKVEKVLANPPQSDNKVLQAQLQSLRDKYQALTGMMPAAAALGKACEDTWSGTAELTSQSNAMQAQLDQGLQELNAQQTTISEAKQDIKEADQEFKAWEQKVTTAKKEYQALEQLLQSGNFDKDAVLTQIDKLAFRDESQGLDMASLRTMALNVKALKDELKQSEELYNTIQTETESADAALKKARSEQQQVQGEVAQLLGDLSQQEAQVSDIYQGLLSQQKALLEQRKQLGIQSGDYQQLLKEYEALLKSDISMATKGQQLDQLEAKLSQFEQKLVNVQGQLSGQILALNGLKEKVNTQRDQMQQAAAKLQGLKKELEAKEVRLGELIQEIETSNTKLAKHQSDLQQQISELEKLPYKSSEDRKLLEELKALLGQVNERISINQTAITDAKQKLQDIALVKFDINKTLEAVTQAISSLNLLAEKLEQVITLAQELLAMVNDLLAQVRGQLQDMQHLHQRSQKLESENQATVLAPTPTTPQASSLTDKAVNSLKTFFKGTGAGPSSKTANNQLEKDRDHARETRQAEFLNVLKELQQNEARRKQDHQYKKDQQAMLDDLTDQIIANVYAGGSNTSSQNIVGIQAKSA